MAELYHYGVSKLNGAKVGSGRYPLGSGEEPYQHSDEFLNNVRKLRDSNFEYTDKDGNTYTGDLAIAKSMGLTSTQFRIQLSMANAERRKVDVAKAEALRAEGKSLNEIAEIMGFNNDSSVRSLLNESSKTRMNEAEKTKEFIKKQIDERGMIEVGVGVERELNISREKLNEALYMLELEGYPKYSGRVEQATNSGKHTTITVICPPGTPHKDMYKYDEVNSLKDYISHDDGETFDKAFVYPESMDSSRLKIRYAEEGGKDKDGVIEIRRGVEDLDLGKSHYAQVRILVDGTHYLKGMAVYSDDMPDGTDVIFNTNKTSDVPMISEGKSVLKPIKNDPSNPFGSLIKEGIYDPTDPASDAFEGGQSYYIDKNGNKKLSLINKRAEEGDWNEWSNKLPSQFLSKQSKELINKQLNLAITDKTDEFNEINSLTNPTVKKALLYSFAEDCDSAAVHLQAAALPRQRYQVILPLTSIKDNEVYAPYYDDGETVALIRYPHGGTFEIPIVKVNNKNPEGKRVLGNAPKDAIGINSKVAERLSGADFDGDTVMVIPCNSSRTNVKITSKPPLKDLEGFDPKMQYGGKEEGTYKRMKNTQKEMGVISNLITDMTLRGADEKELARAVRHSMVVIDAEKHGLDYKQSEKDNGIAELKRKYQGHYDEFGKYHEGASTLISRAKSQVSIPKRKGTPKIDPETGKLIYKESEEFYVDKNGKTKMRTQQSTRMAETDDARTLSSGTTQEEAYAKYANTMKALANKARKEIVSTRDIPYSPSARKVYEEEVKSLASKLNIAELNAPRERMAQMMANSTVAAKKKENKDMTKKEIKKASQQALVEARLKVGAERKPIQISQREWEAIQAGAVTTNKLTKIINYADKDVLRQYATPRQTKELSPAKVSRIQAMKSSGYTTSEIAERLGISSSTVTKYL